MSTREILIPVSALVKPLQTCNDENTPTKNMSSTPTKRSNTSTERQWRVAVCVGKSAASESGGGGKELMVVRTDHNGVFRVKKEDVQRGRKLAATQSPTKFINTFQSLFSTTCNYPATPIGIVTTPKLHRHPHRLKVATSTAAKKLLQRCVSVMSRNEEESSLCVVGQSTVFLSRVMDKKLTRLESLHLRSLARLITRAKIILAAWKDYTAIRAPAALLIQTHCRRYLASKFYCQHLLQSCTAASATENKVTNSNSNDNDNDNNDKKTRTQLIRAVVIIQSLYRGRSERKTYAKLLLRSFPGKTTYHDNLEKSHQIMRCAIQLRDPFECDRVLTRMECLHQRLQLLHSYAWGKEVISTFDASMEQLSAAIKIEDYDTLESIFDSVLQEYEDVLIESREAAGCSSLQSIEKLITRAEMDLQNAIAHKKFDMCTKINSNIQRLHRARSNARDEETMSFSKCASEAAATSMTETDKLRQDLNSTREMVNRMQLDRSHLDQSTTRYHQGQNSFRSTTSRRCQQQQNHLSPGTLHRHNRAMKDEEEEVRSQRSQATDVFSCVSKMEMCDSLFTYKMKDRNGQVRKFRSSFKNMNMLLTKVAHRIGGDQIDTKRLTISFVDEDGDNIVLVSDEDLKDSVELERANGSHCLFIKVEEKLKVKMKMRTMREVFEEERADDADSDCNMVHNSNMIHNRSSSSNSSDSNSSSSDGSSDSCSDSEADHDSEEESTVRHMMVQSRKKHVAVDSPCSSSDESEDEEREDQESDDDDCDDDTDCDSPEFPSASMFPESAVKVQPLSRPDPVVVRRRLAHQKRRLGLDDELDQTAILGSVMIASLAALSVFALVRMRS